MVVKCLLPHRHLQQQQVCYTVVLLTVAKPYNTAGGQTAGIGIHDSMGVELCATLCVSFLAKMKPSESDRDSMCQRLYPACNGNVVIS